MMICLRSGYCCINLDVIVVDNPKLGIVDGNLKHKPSGEKCQHLKGDKPGEHSCSIHSEKWYKETPCYQYSQIGKKDSACRIGEYIINKNKTV